MMKRRIRMAACYIVGMVTALFCNETNVTGHLSVSVIPYDANVTMVGPGGEVFDTWDGFYYNHNVPVGKYILEFKKGNDSTQRILVDVKADRVTSVNQNMSAFSKRNQSNVKFTGNKNELSAKSEKTIRSKKGKSRIDAGLQVGSGLGVTARYFFSESRSLEVIFKTRHFSSFVLTGRYERHDISEFYGIKLILGAGIHTGYYKYGYFYGSRMALGMTAVASGEYNLKDLLSIPLSVSLDWTPSVDIIGGWSDAYLDFNVSVRYRIK